MDFSLATQQPSKYVNRLKEYDAAYAREERRKERRMWSIIHEFVAYLVFSILVSLVVYSNRDSNSFLQVKHMREFFLNIDQSDFNYEKILTIDDYWQWLENSFVSNILAQPWYNGDNPSNLDRFINDRSNRLIGWPIMRQLRVKPELCSDRRIISQCEKDYNYFNEEKRSFPVGWTNQTSSKEYSESILNAFQYATSDELDTYVHAGQYGTYSGNGYVYKFDGDLSDLQSNLSELHQLGWIDQKTRAVFIQLTLYNPNSQLFTSVTFLLEFLSASGVYPTALFQPLHFYIFTSLLQLICMIIFIVFVIYFTIIEIRSMIETKLKYFRQYWSLIHLGTIGCSWGSVGVYIWRFNESNRIRHLFQQTNGNTYINLETVVYINGTLTCLLGFCCFFGMIKFIDFFRFNHRLSLFTKTIQYAAKDLLAFLMMFSLIFMAFLSLFYLLFNSNIQSCSDLLEAAQMLFEMTVMKYSTKEFTGASAFFGPFCFSLFIIFVVFICLNMFLSIINSTFRRIRKMKIYEEEIGSLMLKKFLRWTGLQKATMLEIQEQHDNRMRSLYFDPIENFPDRIDQLLEVIARIYVNQKYEISRLDKITAGIS